MNEPSMEVSLESLVAGLGGTPESTPSESDLVNIGPIPDKDNGESKAESKADTGGSERGDSRESDKEDRSLKLLAKKEAENSRRLKAENQKLHEERQALEAQKKEVESLIQFKQLLAKNPLKALESVGLSYDKMTDLVLTGEQQEAPTTIEDVKAYVQKTLEEERAKLKAEAEAQQIEQTIKQFKAEVTNFINTNSEKYEFIALNDAHDKVSDLIQAHYLENNELLSTEQAADLLEEHYTEVARKLASAKKLANPTQPKSEPKSTQKKTESKKTEPQTDMTADELDAIFPGLSSLRSASAASLKADTEPHNEQETWAKVSKMLKGQV